MLDSALISVLSSAGVAGIFCVLFVTGLIYPRPVVTDKDREIAELKQALTAERQRGDAAVAAAAATKDVMTAIQFGQRIGGGEHP